MAVAVTSPSCRTSDDTAKCTKTREIIVLQTNDLNFYTCVTNHCHYEFMDPPPGGLKPPCTIFPPVSVDMISNLASSYCYCPYTLYNSDRHAARDFALPFISFCTVFTHDACLRPKCPSSRKSAFRVLEIMEYPSSPSCLLRSFTGVRLLC